MVIQTFKLSYFYSSMYYNYYQVIVGENKDSYRDFTWTWVKEISCTWFINWNNELKNP